MTESADEVLKRLRKKTQAAARILNSPDGKVLMEALETEFIPVNIIGKDALETYYSLGQRDVVMYLKQLLNFEEKYER